MTKRDGLNNEYLIFRFIERKRLSRAFICIFLNHGWKVLWRIYYIVGFLYKYLNWEIAAEWSFCKLALKTTLYCRKVAIFHGLKIFTCDYKKVVKIIKYYFSYFITLTSTVNSTDRSLGKSYFVKMFKMGYLPSLPVLVSLAQCKFVN